MKQRRALVVEDNIINQKVAALILEKIGWTVLVANDGREALELLDHGPVDVVFMDAQMPVMDGFEATAEIRKREGDKRHTPIIAITAHVMAGDREKCLEAGMDDYVSKPLEGGDLQAALERQLEK
jgi:CheY-like chemotaxis protein